MASIRLFRQLEFIGIAEKDAGADFNEFMGQKLEIKRRAYSRKISLSVHYNGVIRVNCNKSLSHRKIYDFLQNNRKWLSKQINEVKTLQAAHPRKLYEPGERFLFLGRPVYLDIRTDKGNTFEIGLRKDQLRINFNEPYNAKMVKDAVHKFYQEKGTMVLGARVEHHSNEMGLFPYQVSFRSQKSRWGSCTSTGKISLNWRLISAPLPVIDYVVVHELAHLRHQNHSSRFWELVGDFSPDYRVHSRWLRDNQFEMDFLGIKSELHE